MTKLDQMIASIEKKHVYIQMHNFPDPDAIASAYGLQVLLEQKAIQSTICYQGNIEQTPAAKMVQLLNITIKELHDMEKINQDAEIILVDSQRENANTIELPGSKIICIDHHPTFEQAYYDFKDIRPEMGACGSIIAQYFFENEIEINQNVATALLYGIKIDTANLTRGVDPLDLEMFYQLYKIADTDLIAQLDTSVLNVDHLKTYALAFNSIRINHRVCFADAGEHCNEALIASICDFLLALDEVDVVIVYCTRPDGIKLSVRSKGGFNAGMIANCALAGIGNGGGHENMAGGFVPFDTKDIKSKEESDKKLSDLLLKVEEQIIHWTIQMPTK